MGVEGEHRGLGKKKAKNLFTFVSNKIDFPLYVLHVGLCILGFNSRQALVIYFSFT